MQLYIVDVWVLSPPPLLPRAFAGETQYFCVCYFFAIMRRMQLPLPLVGLLLFLAPPSNVLKDELNFFFFKKNYCQ